MSFARLDELCRKLEALGHAEAMLQVDEAVSMPPGGGEKRAEAMGTIAGLAHELATSPAVGDWIAAAKAENL
ncbi:MAG: carboxypeptidase M32, partial [Hyphomicrobiales bacterium]